MDSSRASRSFRVASAALALLCAQPLLAGCAANSLVGIPFAAGVADPELQALATRARAGDKQAQLELGIRYEEGHGVPMNLHQAERLYLQAVRGATDVRATWSPGVGSSPGQLIYTDQARGASPLLPAIIRLNRLRSRLASQDSLVSSETR